MSKFTMPAAGTPEYEALRERWSAQQASFGQCVKAKQLFKQVSEAGGWDGKVGPKTAAALADRSTRDDEGRWTRLRTDSDLTKWGAHCLIETLTGVLSHGMTSRKADPAPAKGHRKVTIPADVTPVRFDDGDLVIAGGETKRVTKGANGRWYLAKV